LSGTVQDTSGGVIVGATITARNIDTGVETRATTNNAGAYTLVLQPGNNYEVYADASGFQRTIRTGVRLISGAQVNLPLPMAVAGQVTEIEVTGTVESMTLEASASTGTVLAEDLIEAIPTLSGNAIDATLNLMGGVTRITTGGTIYSANDTTVAGVPANMVNVSRDGITVNEVRNPTGVAAAGNINPEVVGEMRVILSAVDAELGRGASQIQVQTRSGSNAYRGSAVWNNQNTALDAADFSYKVRGLERNWRNVNNYTLSASGPISRNRTFFFFSWEQQIALDKVSQIPRVMTSCARRGIYRWLTSADVHVRGGWLPNTINATNSYNLSTGNMRSVNDDGTPWAGNEGVFNSSTSAETPIGPTTVMFESVFGNLRGDVRAALADRNNPKGVYGNGVDACTLMDEAPFNYDPMNNRFLTTTDGQNANAWTGDFASGGAYRYAYDPTGFADRFARTGAPFSEGRTIMPNANYFRGQGDGLNSAGFKWTTAMVGQMAGTYGIGGDPNRKSINTRIDHNISNDHRLSGTFNWESYYIWNSYRVWPQEYGSYQGQITRKPIGLTINLNSTLAPTLLNEFRFGLSRSNTWTESPLDAKDGAKTREVLKALSLNDASNPYYAGSWAQDQVIIIGLGDGDGGTQNTAGALNATAYRPDVNPVMAASDNIDRSHPYGTRGNLTATYGGYDPRWSFVETITWLKGSHSFKAGFEYRRQSSFQSTTGATTMTGGGGSFGRGGGYTETPVVRGGVTGATTQRRRQSLSSNGFGVFDGVNYLYTGSQDTSTTTSGNYIHPYNLMSFFSGSLNDTSMYFFAVPDPASPNGARWNNVEAGENEYSFTIKNQEFSWFFKDDWKLTPSLTLNLGVRWEYYGIPYATGGRTLSIAGGSKNAWGITQPGEFYNNGKGWVVDRKYLDPAGWDASGNPILPDPVIRYEFIGPDSPNSGRSAWNKDTNNFAPHVGFAWQLPWFGRGLTTLRGGYSISYSTIDNFDSFPSQFVNVPAAVTSRAEVFTGAGDRFDPATSSYYMDLTDLKTLLPVQPSASVVPLGVQLNNAIYGQAATAIDENLTNPYVHSLNMSMTRSIGRYFTVDVRYVGTFRRKPIGNLDVNANSFLDTTFFNWTEELDKVRAGGESAYINSMIPHNGPAGSKLYYSNVFNETGSDQLRRQQAGNIARGVYSTIVSSLGSTNGQLTQVTGSEAGMLMRTGCLPQNRPGYLAAFALNNRTPVTGFPCDVALPANMFYTAPQYSTVNVRHNTNAKHNYNSMQAQVTMRPAHGLNFQSTYTWSRNIGMNAWSNYLEDRDYYLANQHRSHSLRFFGTYGLPFGARGLLLRSASGAVKKAVEGWQLSWVYSMESGPPLSVTGSSVLYGRSWPVLVRSDLWNDKQGKARMQWGDKGEFLPGTYLAREYVNVLDRNICNPDRMTPALYAAQCESASGVIYGTYALALAERNSSGALVPVKYDRDTMGDDGVMYKAGTDVIVFRNADQSDGRNAGGNYKPNRMTAQGRRTFDMAITKRIEFMEGKSFELRVDAQNVLNHPTPSYNTGTPILESGGRYMSIDSPALGIATAGQLPYGSLNLKTGHRTFQARMAFRF
jgi:hypothetical protein